jgi:hypothetical protein
MKSEKIIKAANIKIYFLTPLLFTLRLITNSGMVNEHILLLLPSFSTLMD